MPKKSPKRTSSSTRKPASRGRSTREQRGTTPEQPDTGAIPDVRPSAFDPETLVKSVIALPLLDMLKRDRGQRDKLHRVVIDLNLEHEGGLPAARDWVEKTTSKIIAEIGIHKEPEQGLTHLGNLPDRTPPDRTAKQKRIGEEAEGHSPVTQQYLYGRLEERVIRELVRSDTEGRDAPHDAKSGGGLRGRAIYHIWPDFQVKPLVYKSIATVKADAAHASFAAMGDGIVWAVLDSGIDKEHPHFKQWGNLDLESPLRHADFSGSGSAEKDPLGHGTHVAGIIAGGLAVDPNARGKDGKIIAVTRYRKENGETDQAPLTIPAISGMAPRCKLVSFRVLDEKGEGQVSSVLAAIARIQEINGYGRRLLIHGVNMSIGYDFEPEWFACGQSPLCVEVNRLVRSGVVVVVSAGNRGYGWTQTKMEEVVPAGLEMTICDPGNADLAITVGSTHRDMPHIYGVSYFSSKGPTGDGRSKPDLVAPGEKIISCATGTLSKQARGSKCNYIENSGTSMSAPHVSGVIAAFLSVRREFIGQPERVKEIFLSTATDLKRERYFQGYGLVDLMRAIQSV